MQRIEDRFTGELQRWPKPSCAKQAKAAEERTTPERPPLLMDAEAVAKSAPAVSPPTLPVKVDGELRSVLHKKKLKAQCQC
jgi:hypothetical protein